MNSYKKPIRKMDESNDDEFADGLSHILEDIGWKLSKQELFSPELDNVSNLYEYDGDPMLERPEKTKLFISRAKEIIKRYNEGKLSTKSVITAHIKDPIYIGRRKKSTKPKTKRCVCKR